MIYPITKLTNRVKWFVNQGQTCSDLKSHIAFNEVSSCINHELFNSQYAWSLLQEFVFIENNGTIMEKVDKVASGFQELRINVMIPVGGETNQVVYDSNY